MKTMESPRDLVVSDEITQYAPLEGDMEKTADILLLVRPDYTIYDELRKTKDFRIFTDMRLAGVGMVGVVHATKAIDALQRFIGRVELGMIPQIVDTIIFIKDGEVKKVYKIEMTVKVPSGMQEADLARPVIEVKDFESEEVEYEIYTFGEETVVMPIKRREETPLEKLAKERIIQEIRKHAPRARIDVKVSDSKAVVWINEKYIPQIIGKHGRNIEKIEKNLGISIDVRAFEELEEKEKRIPPIEKIPVDIEETADYIILRLGKKYALKLVRIYADGDYLFTATTSRKGDIKVSRESTLADKINGALIKGSKIYAVLSS